MSRIPRSEVDPRKPTDKAIKQASALETLYNYILWQHRPLCRDAFQKQLLRGMAVGKVWYDDRYQGINKKGFTQADYDNLSHSALERFPLKLSVCDALNCYPSLAMQTYYQPVDMIEHYEMSVPQALYLCKMNDWPTGWQKRLEADAEKVKYTTFYSNEQRIVLLNDETVIDGENPLGFVPYVVIPSGLGQDSYEGKPEYKFRDIIYQDMEMNELQTMIMSYLHYGFRKNALPQESWTVQNVEEAKNQFADYQLGNPGVVNIHGEDMKRDEVKTEPINMGIFTLLSMVQSMSGVPSVLMGLPAQNTYSEVHYATQAAYAKAQYEIALDHLEMGWAELLGMCARIVEWLDNPLTIRNVNPGEQSKHMETFRPEDVDGYYQCRVKFIGGDPEGRLTRETQGRELLREKVMPYVDVMMGYFDKPRAEAERMQLDLDFEAIKDLPQFKLASALEIADERGYQRAFEMIALEMVNTGMQIPEWAQMKLSQGMGQTTMPNLPRGGDNRMAPVQNAAEMVPLHAQGTAGTNPREVMARQV